MDSIIKFSIVIPSLKLIHPLIIYSDKTFSEVIANLRDSGLPSDLFYYNGVEIVPIQPSNKISTLFPLRRSQVIILALYDQEELFLTKTAQDEGIMVLLLLPKLRGVMGLNLSPKITVGGIMNILRRDLKIGVSLTKMSDGMIRDLIDLDQTIDELLPNRYDHILFTLTDQDQAIFENPNTLSMSSVIYLCHEKSVNFCDLEEFWRDSVQNIFGMTFKESSLTWKEQYFKIHNFDTPTLLMRGVVSNKFKLIDYAIDHTYEPILDYLNQALYIASESGNIEAVELLLNKGANDYIGAVYKAVDGRQLEIIDMVANRGYLDNPKELYYRAALNQAARIGDIEMINEMNKRAAGWGGYHEAIEAAKRAGHEDIVQMLSKLKHDAEWAERRERARRRNL